jgi:hypothetical protein
MVSSSKSSNSLKKRPRVRSCPSVTQPRTTRGCRDDDTGLRRQPAVGNCAVARFRNANQDCAGLSGFGSGEIVICRTASICSAAKKATPSEAEIVPGLAMASRSSPSDEMAVNGPTLSDVWSDAASHRESRCSLHPSCCYGCFPTWLSFPRMLAPPQSGASSHRRLTHERIGSPDVWTPP